MSCSECVIHKNIAEGRQVLRESLSVLRLFCPITCVLKQDDLSVLHSLNCCLSVRPNNFRICCKFHFLSQKLCQPCCHGSQGQFRLRLSLRLAKMGAEDNLPAICNQFFNRRQGCNQTVLICNLALFQRYVEITSAKHTLSANIDIIY